jgi:hypothetical protein
MENINVSTPNDGLGDPLRNAFIKVNANFEELSALKADLVNGKVPLSQLPAKIVSQTTPSGTPSDGDEWIMYDTSMFSIDSYSSPNLYFTRNYGNDTVVTVQTSTNGTTWVNNTSGVSSPRNIGGLATGTLIRLISISDSTLSNVITV